MAVVVDVVVVIVINIDVVVVVVVVDIRFNLCDGFYATISFWSGWLENVNDGGEMRIFLGATKSLYVPPNRAVSTSGGLSVSPSHGPWTDRPSMRVVYWHVYSALLFISVQFRK